MVRTREQLTPPEQGPDPDRWPGLLGRLDAAIERLAELLTGWMDQEEE